MEDGKRITMLRKLRLAAIALLAPVLALSACSVSVDYEKTEWSDSEWAAACQKFDGWSWVSAEPVFVFQRVCTGHSGSTSKDISGLYAFRTAEFTRWDSNNVSVSRMSASEETNPYLIADDAVKVGECFTSEHRSGSLDALKGGDVRVRWVNAVLGTTGGAPPYVASGRIPTASGYCEATVWSLDEEISTETAEIFDGSRHG